MISGVFSRTILALVAIVGVAFSVGGLAIAQSPELSEEHLQKIRQNCTAAQITMQRVQQSDIATRINYGRAYDSLQTRLMTPLNTRTVVDRSQIAPPLAEQTKLFSTKVDAFRDDYAAYTNVLSSAIRMKCQDKPAEFYETVKRAQELRAKVARTTEEIKAVIREYGRITADYRQSLEGETE